LTRSLADFAKLVELFDAHQVSFVSVTQAFNTTTSMGRLTLNVLLSFAQFEREVTGERIRDKIAASKRKGICLISRSAASCGSRLFSTRRTPGCRYGPTGRARP
jgi:DNA invertase Pin-like site-specific DNA recombinase